MRSLFVFLLRYGSFFLFILLECISIYLIVNFNKEQNEIYLYSVGKLGGKVDEIRSESKIYLNSNQTVEDLINQKLALSEKLAFYQSAEFSGQVLSDSSVFDSSYTFLSAQVINNTVNRVNNYITLDKGRKDGVEERMGVLSDRGVVGVVRDVGENYSLVMSLLHKQSHLSASIKGKNYFGSLSWKSLDPKLVTLEEIPKHAEIVTGDTVLTSGYDYLFPGGLPVGVVKDIQIKEGGNTFSIGVELSSDISSIRNVYLINRMDRKEILELEQAVQNEQ